jgi:peptidoglycan/LPS O-acetylase OafA/YrhL
MFRLWRFYCPGELTQEREALLRKREKRASMAISFIMILLGLSVIIAATEDLARGPESESEMNLVLVLSFFSIVVFGAITIVKFRLANKLDSISLYKDGVCSLIGTVLACGVFATTFVIEQAPSLWRLDPLFAICCGFAALFLGAQAIYGASVVQGTPIFTRTWWFESAGDDNEIDEFGVPGKTVEMTDSEDKTKLSEVV